MILLPDMGDCILLELHLLCLAWVVPRAQAIAEALRLCQVRCQVEPKQDRHRPVAAKTVAGTKSATNNRSLNRRSSSRNIKMGFTDMKIYVVASQDLHVSDDRPSPNPRAPKPQRINLIRNPILIHAIYLLCIKMTIYVCIYILHACIISCGYGWIRQFT